MARPRIGEPGNRTWPLLWRPIWCAESPRARSRAPRSRTGPADGARNAIMLTDYVQERLLDRVVERLKRCWVFVAHCFRP